MRQQTVSLALKMSSEISDSVKDYSTLNESVIANEYVNSDETMVNNTHFVRVATN